ncbi:uncharacterized protein PHACADRAFT_201680 [Phanerochaete carnosa HHB-10118-sp]|uniref:Uncharacterized protein n=1 Tax=Phanerochaete carnosa (strain HHB-10118-sp) TaxID=650164 RepID=K5WGU2_PHACS|nr:uncharacterized protein PHACADRAFT_201680 [Phanerochaete carnosa HHB-10118-sp]EKM49417.1 hypothetical protein PHACADRAFT_201680 [Phanerochaete carnosa HHB-10118-sp]
MSIPSAVRMSSSSFDPTPFMVMIIALLNDGTIMTLSIDRALPLNTPDSWSLPVIFASAFTYDIYLALLTITLVAVCIRTTPSFDKFGATSWTVATILRALIFITPHISSAIASYSDWGFTEVAAVEGSWIGITWDTCWFLSMGFVKFAMKATSIKYLRNSLAASVLACHVDPQLTVLDRVGFLRRAAHRVSIQQKVSVKPDELLRFSSIQTTQTGSVLACHLSRAQA